MRMTTQEFLSSRFLYHRSKGESEASAKSEARSELTKALFDRYRSEGFPVKDAMNMARSLAAKEYKIQFKGHRRSKMNPPRPAYTVVDRRTRKPVGVTRKMIPAGKPFKVAGRRYVALEREGDVIPASRTRYGQNPSKKNPREVPVYHAPGEGPEEQKAWEHLEQRRALGVFGIEGRRAGPVRPPMLYPEPRLFDVVHHKTKTHLFTIRHASPPAKGAWYRFDPFDYEYRKIVGDTIYARPQPEYRYAVIVRIKATGEEDFIPVPARRYIKWAKEQVKAGLAKAGRSRKDYTIRTQPWHAFRQFRKKGIA